MPTVATKPIPPFKNRQLESAFQNWYALNAKLNHIDPNPDHPLHYYDFRRAFLAGEGPGLDRHWSSEFKLAGHPNRYVDGVDTITGNPAPKSLSELLRILD